MRECWHPRDWFSPASVQLRQHNVLLIWPIFLSQVEKHMQDFSLSLSLLDIEEGRYLVVINLFSFSSIEEEIFLSFSIVKRLHFCFILSPPPPP
jgi:hypothetical protein